MIICAFDCSSVSCSAAVVRDGEILSYTYQNTGLTHSQTLLVNIKNALSVAGIAICDVDRLALTVGPGSFTGIKIGVATAKGLAFTQDIPCTAISSLEAAAANCEGTVTAVMDARRQMFYTATFQTKNGLPKRLTPDAQLSAQDIIEALTDNVTVTGDGARLLCSLADRPNCCAAPSARYVNAASIAILAAAGYGQTVSAAQLRPVYLRPPQAERERLEKLQQGR